VRRTSLVKCAATVWQAIVLHQEAAFDFGVRWGLAVGLVLVVNLKHTG
jgi:hypothetical protein